MRRLLGVRIVASALMAVPRQASAAVQVTLTVSPSTASVGQPVEVLLALFAAGIVLRRCYSDRVKTISQRELRNDSGAVMHEVQQGATFRVTHRGTPIATLAPIESSAIDELTIREGTQVMTFPPGAHIPERTDEVLAESRRRR